MKIEANAYELSGKTGNGLNILTFVFACYAFSVGFGTGYIAGYNTVVSVCINIGLIILTTVVFNSAIKKSKCRNSNMIMTLSFLGAAASYYLMWVGYLYHYAGGNFSFEYLFGSPLQMLKGMNAIAYSDQYEVFTGIGAWIVWIIEAGVMVFGIGLMAGGYTEGEAFCEPCNQWCDDDNALQKNFGLPASDQEIEDLASGNLTALKAFPPKPKGKSQAYLEIKFKRCNNCQNFGTYQLMKVTFSRDNEGNLEESKDKLSEQIVINKEALSWFQNLEDKLQKTEYRKE